MPPAAPVTIATWPSKRALMLPDGTPLGNDPPERLSLWQTVATASLASLRQRQEWKFFSVLPRADTPLATLWWIVLVSRGVLPALFGIAMGLLVRAVQQGQDL